MKGRLLVLCMLMESTMVALVVSMVLLMINAPEVKKPTTTLYVSGTILVLIFWHLRDQLRDIRLGWDRRLPENEAEKSGGPS